MSRPGNFQPRQLDLARPGNPSSFVLRDFGLIRVFGILAWFSEPHIVVPREASNSTPYMDTVSRSPRSEVGGLAALMFKDCTEVFHVVRALGLSRDGSKGMGARGAEEVRKT